MIIFDSNEYWQKTTWDRYRELDKVPEVVRDEFFKQEELTLSHILSLANEKKELKIMDLACGTGKIAESILKTTTEKEKITMTLVDFNATTLELAKKYLKYYQNVSYIEMDVYKIADVFDECFDVVICLDLLHHITDLNTLFTQIKKILKPNRLLIGNVFAANSYNEWDMLKYGVIRSWKRRILFLLSNAVYHKSSDTIKLAIRRLGLARIAPLTNDELISNLKLHFENIEIISSYYYWFSARAK